MSRHDMCKVKLKEPSLPFATSPFPCAAIVIMEALVEMQSPVSLSTKGEQEWLIKQVERT